MERHWNLSCSMRVNEPVLDLNVEEKKKIHLFKKQNETPGSQCRLLMKIKGQYLQCPTSVHALGHVNNGNPIIFLQ